MNLIKNKIPFVSEELPISYTNFGAVREIYPKETNDMIGILYNALINPEVSNLYALEPEQEFLIGLYELLPPIEYATKEEKDKKEIIDAMYAAMGKKPPKNPDQPRYDVLPNTWKTIRHPDGKSEPHEMTDAEKIVYQVAVNDAVIAGMNNLFIDPKFKNGTPDEQLALIKTVVKGAGTTVERQMQIDIFGYAYNQNKSYTTKYNSTTSMISAYRKASKPKELNLPTTTTAKKRIGGL
jgi:hypothetical protein